MALLYSDGYDMILILEDGTKYKLHGIRVTDIKYNAPEYMTHYSKDNMRVDIEFSYSEQQKLPWYKRLYYYLKKEISKINGRY